MNIFILKFRYKDPAYNWVEWHMVKVIIRKLGFVVNWVELVMRYVRTIRYFMIVNGDPRGSIVPMRGLYQGDPLSLFLFPFCSEELSSFSCFACVDGLLLGVQASKGGPCISHLFFTDDKLIFSFMTAVGANIVV